MQLTAGAHLHLLGIGGVGMSALAHLAAGRGFHVSGSDARVSTRISSLRDAGIDAQVPHGELPDCELVARSPALKDGHPLVRAAQQRGLPLVHRAELLAALLPERGRVGVAGTHGKSTTTAMLAHIAVCAGLDPTVVVGADVAGLGGGHRLGHGELSIFEACEGFGALDQTPAPIACVTNVDDDHVEQFGSFEAIVASFERLCAGASRGLALGTDDPRLRAWSERLDAASSFGLHEGADLRGVRCGASVCAVSLEGQPLGELRLWAPGRHNLRNALGALATARMLGVEPEQGLAALSSFAGLSRRLEHVGCVQGAPVLDDYAHHPSEVAAAIEAARSGWSGARLIAVFEPHLPSREQRLRGRFAEALCSADVVIVTPTHAAREPESQTAELPLVRCVAALGHREVCGVKGLEQAASMVRAKVREGDVVLVMGAGGVTKVARALAAADS